jgi:hypothetical protein
MDGIAALLRFLSGLAVGGGRENFALTSSYHYVTKIIIT